MLIRFPWISRVTCDFSRETWKTWKTPGKREYYAADLELRVLDTRTGSHHSFCLRNYNGFTLSDQNAARVVRIE